MLQNISLRSYHAECCRKVSGSSQYKPLNIKGKQSELAVRDSCQSNLVRAYVL